MASAYSGPRPAVGVAGPLNEPQVLIVGAGPVGLVLVIDLAQRGITVQVVECDDRPRQLPKMERCNARTMEIFRRLGVAKQVRAASDGLETVSASYRVGCDGGASTVRKQRGIMLEGEGRLKRVHQIFYSPNGAMIVQDDLKHFMLNVYEIPEGTDPADMVLDFLRIPVDAEVLHTSEWNFNLLVAECYGKGRVLLAGDAAHLVIPVGGLGMNTGIGDVIDLGWKLAATLVGWGGPELLRSYETERCPVGQRNICAAREAAGGMLAWQGIRTVGLRDDTPESHAIRRQVPPVASRTHRIGFEMTGIERGYHYVGSPHVIDDGADAPDPDSMAFVPTSAPGTRIPPCLAGGRPCPAGRPRTRLHAVEGGEPRHQHVADRAGLGRYTSGTAGPSKGVVLPHAHAYTVGASRPFGGGWLDTDRDDVNYVFLPLYLQAGQWDGVLNAFIAGASAYLAPAIRRSAAEPTGRAAATRSGSWTTRTSRFPTVRPASSSSVRRSPGPRSSATTTSRKSPWTCGAMAGGTRVTRCGRSGTGPLSSSTGSRTASAAAGRAFSSLEVEAGVLAHPQVRECAAHPVPSELGEDEVMVAVIVDPPLEAEALGAYLGERMPKFLQPRFIRILEDLPKTPTAKVQKAELKRQGRQGAWDRNAAAARPPSQQEGAV